MNMPSNFPRAEDPSAQTPQFPECCPQSTWMDRRLPLAAWFMWKACVDLRSQRVLTYTLKINSFYVFVFMMEPIGGLSWGWSVLFLLKNNIFLAPLRCHMFQILKQAESSSRERGAAGGRHKPWRQSLEEQNTSLGRLPGSNPNPEGHSHRRGLSPDDKPCARWSKQFPKLWPASAFPQQKTKRGSLVSTLSVSLGLQGLVAQRGPSS